MALELKTERKHLVSIAATVPGWIQTHPIPVIYEELKIGPTTSVRLTFPFQTSDWQSSPLDILAGGETMELAEKRIRAQMIRYLETGLSTANPSLNIISKIQQIRQYFEKPER